MKRTLMFVVIAMLMAGGAFAQCPMMGAAQTADDEVAVAACPSGMQMRQGPMARMAGALDTAVWGDFVYVLQGNMLEKRDMDGNTLKSVQLDDMDATMEQMEDARICPICGMPMDEETRAGCPGGMGMMGGMQGSMGQMHGRMHGGAMMGQGMTMQGMRAMQRGRMYSCVRLQADPDGVYLLRGGKFTKFDHDLNKVKSWSAISEQCAAQDNACECAMRHMRRAACPTCRMMMGALVDERGISGGKVSIWHRPAMLTPGMVRFQVQVDELDGRGDADAKVNAYLYPKGNPNAGMGVTMRPVGGGHFYGMAEMPGAGSWELALRVMRPDMEDVRVYYDLPVE